MVVRTAPVADAAFGTAAPLCPATRQSGAAATPAAAGTWVIEPAVAVAMAAGTTATTATGPRMISRCRTPACARLFQICIDEIPPGNGLTPYS